MTSHPLYTIDPASGCWIWNGSTNDNGYGTILLNYNVLLAHRVWYVVHVGPTEHDKWVLHRCDNPPCVNPDHLYLGTPLQNVLDKMERTPHARTALTFARAQQVRDALLEAKCRGDHGRIAEHFGISKSTLSAIASGKRWVHPDQPPPPNLSERRLTQDQHRAIVAEFTGEWGQKKRLAEKYGVTPAAIGYILRKHGKSHHRHTVG
jgi:hypothetical protein